MRFDVFLLVVIAAGMHALWNLGARKAKGDAGVLWLGLCAASVVCAPLAFWTRPTLQVLVDGLPLILATGVIHALYFVALSKAYETGEISFVYPVARGMGVAGTATAATLILEETISPLGGLGIGTVVLGIFLLGLDEFRATRDVRSGVLAVLVGGTIIGYSVVDKVGVGIVHPVFYIFAMFVLSALGALPYVLGRRRGICADAWRNMKRYIFLIGLGSMATYLLILFAFQLGRVSYVVAIREFSVVIGAALGVLVLGERFTARKGLGIAAITLGVVLVKLAR